MTRPGTDADHAIVFDFDGVIADSEPAHELAMRESARAQGLDFTHEQYVDRIIGFDDRDAFRIIAGLCGREPEPGLLEAMAADKVERFEAMVERGEIRVFEGAEALARAASDVVPIAVCSGALRNEVEMILERSGMRSLFRFVVTADDVPAAKPDPAGYLLTAQKLGVEPSRCVTIEDTPTGLTAARDAGYKLAAVGHSFSHDALGPVDLFAQTIDRIGVEDLLALVRG